MKKTIAIGTMLLSMGVQAQLEEAIKLTDKEQFEKATAQYKAAITAAPTSGEAWFYMGENYWYNDKRDSALTCYRKGAEVNPRLPLNHIGIGKALRTQGDQASANAKFAEALSLIEEKTNKFSKPVKGVAYRELAEAVASGSTPDFATANTHLAKAETLNPSDIEIFILRGDLAVLNDIRNGPTVAVAEYNKAINLQGTNPKPLTKKAIMYHRSGRNPTAAIEEYNKAIGFDANYAPAYRGRAEAYFSNKDYDKATADYNKYLELNGGNKSAQVRYAQFLFLVKKYDESLKLIDELEGQGVENNALNRIKGYDLVELGDTVRAIPALDKYFGKQPPDLVIPGDLYYYGKALGLLRKDSLAGEKMLEAARMPRSEPEYYDEAAKAFKKGKAYGREADALYEGLKANDQPKANDFFYLGHAAIRAKRHNLADSVWTVYIQRNEKAYQGHLGRARAQVGMDSTRTTWQAKPFYEDVLRRMKPEEIEKSKTDAEEAYFYLGYYYYDKEKNIPMAKCFMEKVKAINAGTANTQIATNMLGRNDMKDLTPADCTVQ
ncbi:MAG: hypothetical protein IPJ76_09900 [Flavobacteriales bacterium]|nr:MAG: hypothetical protein IPJ76_09900 [Flavobacteriales bacterium]